MEGTNHADDNVGQMGDRIYELTEKVNKIKQ
jgi:hypothetical protein